MAAILPANATDLVTPQVMAAEYLMLLADRDISVLAHPAFFHATGKPGSQVVRVPHLGYGYDLLSADIPGSEHSETDFADGHTDVTLANLVLNQGAHDLARFMTNGVFDPAMLAQFAAVSVGQTLISLAANVGDGFTNVAGSSGVDATWDDVLVGKAFLGISKASGNICGLIHTQQWNDLEGDALSLGVLPAQSMAGVLASGLDAYKGRYMGIDFFTSSAVPASGGNRLGSLFTTGGIVWADAEYVQDPGNNDIISIGRAQMERVRKGTFSQTNWVIRAMMGVALGIDGAGVTFRTDE